MRLPRAIKGPVGGGVLILAIGFVAVLTWNALADRRPTATGVAVPKACHVRGRGLFVLPDPRCTPGATEPAVTHADFDRTICSPGWTTTVRPPESVTEPVKRQLVRAYGYYAGHRLSSYELDHLQPIELGGDPDSVTDTRNLWPEVDYQGVSPRSYDRNPKDALERTLKAKVCRGAMSLATARRLIATNWVAAYRRYVR